MNPLGPEEQPAKRSPFLVVIDGKTPGTGYLLGDLPVSIGRKQATIIPDPDDQATSRLHAILAPQPGEDCWVLQDKNSTNGTKVNGQKIETKRLRSGDKIEIGNTLFKFVDPKLAADQEKFSDRAHVDKLTGLFNEQRFKEMLAESVAEATLYRTPFGLLVLDVDGFEKANETHGRDFGDQILRELSELLTSLLLEDQEMFRIGGEEFAVLLRGPSARFAMDIGEMIRQSVEVYTFRHLEQTISLTLSAGVVFFDTQTKFDQGANEVIQWCHRCLQGAKEGGGNRVCGKNNL